MPIPDGPIASVESPRGMPPPIAASSFGRPKRARGRPARRRAGAASSRGAGTPRSPRCRCRKLCWPDITSAPRIFSTRSRRRSIGPLRLVLELDDPVGDRELRLGARLLGAVLADEDQDGLAVGDLAREVVDGAPELARLDDVVQRLAAVDHDHRRPARRRCGGGSRRPRPSALAASSSTRSARWTNSTRSPSASGVEERERRRGGAPACRAAPTRSCSRSPAARPSRWRSTSAARGSSCRCPAGRRSRAASLPRRLRRGSRRGDASPVVSVVIGFSISSSARCEQRPRVERLAEEHVRFACAARSPGWS